MPGSSPFSASSQLRAAGVLALSEASSSHAHSPLERSRALHVSGGSSKTYFFKQSLTHKSNIKNEKAEMVRLK